jgi:hypothetical protein
MVFFCHSPAWPIGHFEHSTKGSRASPGGLRQALKTFHTKTQCMASCINDGDKFPKVVNYDMSRGSACSRWSNHASYICQCVLVCLVVCERPCVCVARAVRVCMLRRNVDQSLCSLVAKLRINRVRSWILSVSRLDRSTSMYTRTCCTPSPQ